MAKFDALWQAASRKEVMDLLTKLWPAVDNAGRDAITAMLLAGPGDILPNESQDEQRASADRRVYDRIVVIERAGEPPLTPGLANRMADLRQRYPEWRSAEGERAHFSSWTEVRWGPDTRYRAEDLSAKSNDELAIVLRDERDRRDGLMDAWRNLAKGDPMRAYTVLEALVSGADGGPADVWEYGLWGLRDAENAGDTSVRMMQLLTKAPEVLLEKQDVVRGAVDLLEATSRQDFLEGSDNMFWPLFDRILDARADAADDPVDDVISEDGQAGTDWVSQAVNRPIGRLATAFFNKLFARRLKVNDGIPEDLIRRLNALMSPHRVDHRDARVVAASRVSYLMAIDPVWTNRTLIPLFGWRDEEESIAMWQGFAWQAQIDPQLWSVLKQHFIPLFRTDRLLRIGRWGRNIAQMLMLVGVAFGTDEVKRDEGREAIRAMDEKMRSEAAAWIALYMEAERSNEPAEGKEPIEGDADRRWRERVQPWLRKVWPAEPSLRTVRVAEQFALAAIGTETAFPEAVAFIRPHLLPHHSYRALHMLALSSHPEDHPRDTLLLIDAITAKEPLALFEGELRDVIKRVAKADTGVAAENRYRRWRDFLGEPRAK